MTQHMGFMDLSDEEDKDEEPVVGYVEVLSPASLGWKFKQFRDGVYNKMRDGHTVQEGADRERQRQRERQTERDRVAMAVVLCTYFHPHPFIRIASMLCADVRRGGGCQFEKPSGYLVGTNSYNIDMCTHFRVRALGPIVC